MSKLRIYNSFSRKKEVFKPIRGKNITIYVCGITPYDTTHLGHAFLYIQFDVLIRYLQFLGYKVNYTQNVTDIDDDILKKAKEEKRNWIELGNYWTHRFTTDLKELNVLPPTHYVKATESIPTILKFIEKLTKDDFAYKAGPNIYFRVKKFKKYGKLSKYSESQMRKLLTERGGDPKDPNKEYPLDFILWQGKKEGEPFWKSKFGDGRPGWHIECSSMIYDFLEKQIDIHGGGFDLIFPHHESEIAQSESFTGKAPFVKYWMHASMVKFQKEKMSKSLGNLVMIRDLIKKYSPNEIRFMLLSHHYRETWEFREADMEKAKEKFLKIESLPYSGKKPDMKKLNKFFSFLNNDLDTKSALYEVLKLAKYKENSSEVKAALYILGFNLN